VALATLSPTHIYCVNKVPVVANGSQEMWSTIVASGSERVKGWRVRISVTAAC